MARPTTTRGIEAHAGIVGLADPEPAPAPAS
jgi:hypothetical protein